MAILLSTVSIQRKPRFLVSVTALFLAFMLLVHSPRGFTSPYAAMRGAVLGSQMPQLQKLLPPARASADPVVFVNSSVNWAARPPKFPIEDADLVRLPGGAPGPLPHIQYNFRADPDFKAADTKVVRETRRDAVRDAFRRAWESYRQHAWGYDELLPIKLLGKDGFSGWGATLVDGLDTLWVMGLRDEFDEAVRAVATIDWDAAAAFECSLFETNIRYLGGLLSAHEMSGERVLLDKAAELAYMLLAAFDTPAHLPANQFHFDRAWQGLLTPSDHEAAAAVGTLSLEFTRLAQLTGDMRFYDAIDRIKRGLAAVQDATTLPGLWPTFLDLQHGFGAGPTFDGEGGLVDGHMYTLGGMADSLYEYLPKMHILLGGRDPTYAAMYTKVADAARKHLLFRPMIPDPDARGHDILMAGSALAPGGGGTKSGLGSAAVHLVPESQHLTCFAGGMFALGGRLFDRPDDVDVGMRLAEGCVWAYNAFPTGVMPEAFDLLPCPRAQPGSGGWMESLKGAAADGKQESSAQNATTAWPACPWDEQAWREAKSPPGDDSRCPRGFASVRDPRYLLRPEAVESVFLLYRITGDRSLQEAAWTMFLSIQRSTVTRHANSAIADVTVSGPPQKLDSMESFWFAETLKYLYLVFTEPDYFSLDDWVFNTEAHPFKIPKATTSKTG